MNVVDVRAQLEYEFTWRQEEMRLLGNQLSNIAGDSDKSRYRKALLVMLYSHYEGFTKTALSIFVGAINSEGMTCGQVTEEIAAASLAAVFKSFGDTNKKSEMFKRNLPDDSQLHAFARQVELVANLNALWEKPVNIPDMVVDLESNLSPVVLKKALYRLGFPHDAFSAYDGNILALVNYRHAVAHGRRVDGLDEKSYADAQRAAYSIMDGLIRLITAALVDRAFLRDRAAV